MGMYCCCGASISKNQKCTCDWEGWSKIRMSGQNSPRNDERNNPKESGRYLVRYFCNGGDKHENEMNFSVTPYRIDAGGYRPFPIHWERESRDDYHVYAWTEIKDKDKD